MKTIIDEDPYENTFMQCNTFGCNKIIYRKKEIGDNTRIRLELCRIHYEIIN